MTIPAIQDARLCRECKKTLPSSDFYKLRRSEDGLAYSCKGCSSCRSKTWRSNQSDYRHERYKSRRREAASRGLKLRYGIDIVQYEQLLSSQLGRCAICKNEPTASRRLDVDHNHSTGKVRGLLCINCNLALGHLDDNAELAVQTALYLLRNYQIQFHIDEEIL